MNYAKIEYNRDFSGILGIDVGFEQETKKSNRYSGWYSLVVILRYLLGEKVRVAVRGEYYADRQGVIISTGGPQGFQTQGYSVGVDYRISSNVLLRSEARAFISRDKIFTLNGIPSQYNYSFAVALCFSLDS